MSLRIFSLALLTLGLAACSSGDSNGGSAAAASSGGTGQSVPCALAGGRSFTTKCTLERALVDGKTIVTLRHPNGGFRRLIELEGGKRYAAADGSDEVAIEANGAEIEVTLGDDHYLMPGPGSADAAKR